MVLVAAPLSIVQLRLYGGTPFSTYCTAEAVRASLGTAMRPYSQQTATWPIRPHAYPGRRVGLNTRRRFCNRVSQSYQETIWSSKAVRSLTSDLGNIEDMGRSRPFARAWLSCIAIILCRFLGVEGIVLLIYFFRIARTKSSNLSESTPRRVIEIRKALVANY